MHHSVATVPLVVTAAMLYARFAASANVPGLRRLAALIPVLALLLALPFLVPLHSVRGLTAFFLAWLAEFKLLLLAFGHGPLADDDDDPRRIIRPLPFVFTAALPVKLRHVTNNQAAVTKTKTKTVAFTAGIKFAVAGAIAHHVYNSKDRPQQHPYVAFVLYGVITYCVLDSVLPCVAAAAGNAVLGMELEPQFDKPYLSSSLQDFWGRRWNLTASAVLRQAVYDPVRRRSARLGVPAASTAAMMATFLVSGLMHEVVAFYLTFRRTTGRVTAFFVLHGACVCAERWWCVRVRRRCGVRPLLLPRVVATPLVVGFVAGTACWLFLPAIFGDGMDDLFLAETAALASSFRDAGARLLATARQHGFF